jgi:hypothetical protein
MVKVRSKSVGVRDHRALWLSVYIYFAKRYFRLDRVLIEIMNLKL